MSVAIILSAIVATANSPHPDTDIASVRAMVGSWRLSVVGGRVGCTLNLSDREGASGRDLETPAACQRAFPPLKALTVWTLDGHGALVFSDIARHSVVAFTGPTGGPYEATSPDGKAWRLVVAAPKPAADTTP